MVFSEHHSRRCETIHMNRRSFIVAALTPLAVVATAAVVSTASGVPGLTNPHNQLAARRRTTSGKRPDRRTFNRNARNLRPRTNTDGVMPTETPLPS